MVSVLIPVFGEDVSPQLAVLAQEIKRLDYPVEVCVVDDASGKAIPPNFNGISQSRWEELPKNLGRSSIRNYLANQARYDILIFTDADCIPVSANFIERYRKAFQANQVVVGGQVFGARPVSTETYLRWNYGTHVEARSQNRRSEKPYASFMANNFCMSKSQLLTIKFDADHQGYGHEDTLFGMKLRQRKVAVVHIGNEVRHLGLETNHEFLDKTTEGVSNLVNLYQSNRLDHHVRLIAIYEQMQRFLLVPFLIIGYHVIFNTLKKGLRKNGKPLAFFSLFKLLDFAQKIRYSNAPSS